MTEFFEIITVDKTDESYDDIWEDLNIEIDFDFNLDIEIDLDFDELTF